MNESINQTMDMVVGLVTAYGLNVIGAVVILILGWIAAGWCSRTVAKLLSRSDKVDAMLSGFFASFVRYGILAFTVIAVLSRFGVQTASFIAVLGATGLAIGLALQGTLSNVASGVMILLFRPFKVGDYVDAGGIAGTVKSVSLFVTEFATPDNVQIIAPNSQIWNSSIKNFSFHPTRRVDFLIGIAYEDSVDTAMELILGLANADERVHDDPAAMVAVGELADSSVNIILRVWCDAGDYWALKFDLTKAIKQRLDAEGISIPYPQRQIHVIQAGTEVAAAAE